MSNMERVCNGIRRRRLKKKRNILNEARIKGSIYSGLTRVPIHGCSFCAPCPTATHIDAFQFAPDASDDDDDIDAAPAEPAHASSSATSTSAAGEDVSTSTQPSVTNAAELRDVCFIAPRSGVALMPCGHSRFCGNCATHFVVHRSRWCCVFLMDRYRATLCRSTLCLVLG